MLSKLKVLARDQLGLSPSFVLLAAGLCAHVLLNVVLRKPVTAAVGLLAPLSLGIALETVEIWLAYRGTGLLAPGNDPLLAILARHALDVLLLLALPVVLVIGRRAIAA